MFILFDTQKVQEGWLVRKKHKGISWDYATQSWQRNMPEFSYYLVLEIHKRCKKWVQMTILTKDNITRKITISESKRTMIEMQATDDTQNPSGW